PKQAGWGETGPSPAGRYDATWYSPTLGTATTRSNWGDSAALYKRPFGLWLRRLRDCTVACSLEHALGDLALSQDHQVGAKPLEVLDRGVRVGARQDLE